MTVFRYANSLLKLSTGMLVLGALATLCWLPFKTSDHSYAFDINLIGVLIAIVYLPFVPVWMCSVVVQFFLGHSVVDVIITR